MLRASSLGSIFTSTTHHPPRLWSHHTTHHRSSILGTLWGGTLIRSTSTLQRDHNVRGVLAERVTHFEETGINTDHYVSHDESVDTPDQPVDLSNPATGQSKQDSNSGELYVTELPYPTGRSRHLFPITPLFGGKYWYGDCFATCGPSEMAFPPKSLYHVNRHGKNYNDSSKNPRQEEKSYFHLCHVIANTQCASEAWIAYSTLLTLPVPRTHQSRDPNVPFAHLHRLCRLLSRNRPRTRTQFLRLLSVLYYIRKFDGKVRAFEWNALISHAGTGRGAGRDRFKLALDVFGDMISGEPPGTTFSSSEFPPLLHPKQVVPPDLYTYNTLISIAAKTLYGRAVQHASLLLQGSGQSPDRITHLSLLPYFTGFRQLAEVRSTLLKIRHQNLELGLDGINACMWAYGYSGRLNIVKAIYHIMRHNLKHDLSNQEVANFMKVLNGEGIDFSTPITPNEITFTATIQIMAYYGDLTMALRVLLDMLSTSDVEFGAPINPKETGEAKYIKYSPNAAVFRALFLGFSRHGTTDTTYETKDTKTWVLANLQQIYQLYMSLPEPLVPSRWIIYFIMNAFDRTSGHDVELLRNVWTEMEDRFEGPWGGAAYRLQALKKMLFSDNAAEYLQKHGFSTRQKPNNTPWLS